MEIRLPVSHLVNTSLTVATGVAITAMAVSLLCAQSGAPFVELEPGASETFKLYCYNQYGYIVPSCCTVIYHGYYIRTGGHLHDQGRPVSSFQLSPACYNNYQGTDVTIDAWHNIGQWEYAELCGQNCPTCPVTCDLEDVWIRYWPLYDLYGDGVPPYSRPIGAVANYHVENHFGTDVLVYAVDEITRQYEEEFYCVPDAQGILGYQPVGVNDMALEGGGVFDIKAPQGSAYAWKPPHHWHSGGNSVDFRCKPNQPNSIIYVDEVVQRFMRICEEKGLRFQLREDQVPSNEHVHCGVRAGN